MTRRDDDNPRRSEATPTDTFAASEGELLPRGIDEELLPNRTYPSNLFWRMTGGLDPETSPSRILDLGPTSNENIQFWAGRGFQVTCYDLYARESRRLAQDPSSPMTLSADNLRDRRLPYDDEAFTGVCAWNVLGRLPFVLAQRYARECHRVLRRSGLLHAIFLDVSGRLDTRRRYRIADRQQLEVMSATVPRQLPQTWIDAEIKLLLSRFAACELQSAPCNTREVLAQRAPATPLRKESPPAR